MTTQRGKLPDTGTTIFTVMSELAGRHGAINLSQGFPDFQPPAELLDLACRQLREGNNQYAPMTGLPVLREAIAAKIERLYGRRVAAESEVTVTSGATSALFSAIQALVHTGDEVIMFDPAYDSYDPAVRLAGGVPVHVPLRAPDFSIDWDRFADVLSAKTRLIILNSPHNPTGAVLGREDIEQLRNSLRNSDTLVLSDEVYEHMVFDGTRHQSPLQDDELFARSLIVSSFGKSYHATGWKIGYCTGPARLMQQFRAVHQFNQFCVVTPLQAALAEFMLNHPGHTDELSMFYQRKRDLFGELLSESRFGIRPAAGTYFQLADYSAIADAPDTEFTRWLTTEKGVAAIPISVFYANPPEQRVIRFCFAKNDDTLREAAKLLCRI